MSGAIAVEGSPAPAMGDLDLAYKLGTLSGEVRLLKWGVGAAFVAIIAAMGVLYEAIGDVRIDLDEIRKDISALRTVTTGIQKDVTAIDARVVIIERKVETIEQKVETIERKVETIERKVVSIEEDLADLKAMHSSSPAEARGRRGNSLDVPKHVDSAGEPVPHPHITPPA